MTGQHQPRGAGDPIRDLQDAEAGYWAIIDDPEATEADRIDATEFLQQAETRMLEATGETPSSRAEVQVSAPDDLEIGA